MVDDILHRANGSTVFSKIDLKWGFHQVELDEDSRYITTFAANGKLYQYRRLPFGICSAPELYQKIIADVIRGLPGVDNAADDILVYGSTMEEHDQRLHSLLSRLQSVNLTVNPSKCEFRCNSIEFYGLLLSSQGLKPTEEKVNAIVNARPPTSVSEVRSFLGTAGFSARFLPDFSTTAEPLRRLTVKGTPFVWEPEQQVAFDKLKQQLASTTSLAYFDPTAETEVVADASPVGLGAVLIQVKDGHRRPVAYASRTLTAVEKRYSQTEREALGLV